MTKSRDKHHSYRTSWQEPDHQATPPRFDLNQQPKENN
jgi:hypothetical protein